MEPDQALSDHRIKATGSVNWQLVSHRSWHSDFSSSSHCLDSPYWLGKVFSRVISWLLEDRWVSELLFDKLTIEPPTTNQSTNHPEVCHPQVCINKAQIACGTVDHANQYKDH